MRFQFNFQALYLVFDKTLKKGASHSLGAQWQFYISEELSIL